MAAVLAAACSPLTVEDLQPLVDADDTSSGDASDVPDEADPDAGADAPGETREDVDPADTDRGDADTADARDTGPDAPDGCTDNGCGGCTPLPNLDAPCGCADDVYVCDGTDAVVCSGGGGDAEPPAAPRSVVASDGEHGAFVRVTWPAVAGAEAYRVFRDGVYLGEVDAEGGGATYSFDDETATGPPLPTAVVDLTAQDTEAGVRLTWTPAATGAAPSANYTVRAWSEAGCEGAPSSQDSGFRASAPVERYEVRAGAGAWLPIADSGATTSTWTAADGVAVRPAVVAGTATATMGDAAIDLSADGFSATSTPTSLAVRAISAAGAAEPSNAATGRWLPAALTYTWFRGVEGEEPSTDTGLTGESAFDTGAIGASTMYVYRVDVSAGGATPASARTAPVAGIGAVGDVLVEASMSDPEQVTVTWFPVEGAISYEISVDAGPWIDLGNVTEYVDLDAPAPTLFGCDTVIASNGTVADGVDLRCDAVAVVIQGEERRYQVRAIGAVGPGPASVEASGVRAPAGDLRYQWERSLGDTPTDFAPIGSIVNVGGAATDAAFRDTTASFNTLRHYRVVFRESAITDTIRGPASGRSGTPPAVETRDASSVGPTSATLVGAVPDKGGAPTILSSGFCWTQLAPGAEPPPSCAGSSAGDPCAGGWSRGTASGDTLVELPIAGLAPATGYAFCAYATNGLSTAGYGEVRSFTTADAPPPGVPSVTASNNRAEHVEVSWSTVDGATRYELQINGGSWTTVDGSPYLDTAAPAATITPCTVDASDGVPTSQVTLACTGAAVVPGAERTYRVRATIDGRVGDASEPATGSRNGGTLTYAWQRSSGDAASAFSAWGSAPTGATGADTNIGFNAPRYYRVVLGAGSGVATVNTAADRGFRGMQPAVRTDAASAVTPTSAVLNGAVTDLGGAASVSSAGFCWRAGNAAGSCSAGGDGAPCAAGWTGVSVAPAADDSLSSTLTSLAARSAFQFCAYAANGIGVTHGSVVPFTTPAAPPAAPTNLVASTDRDVDVVVTWTAVADATSYEISVNEGAWQPVTTTTWTHTTAPAGSIDRCTTPAATAGTRAADVGLTCNNAPRAVAGATQRYAVRAVGAGGTGSAAETTGARAAGALRAQWQRSIADDASSAFEDIAGATSVPALDAAVAFNTPRYYRLQLNAGPGVTPVTRGPVRGFRGVAGSVETLAATAVHSGFAQVRGNVTDLGGAVDAKTGFCWRAGSGSASCAGATDDSPCAAGWTRASAGSGGLGVFALTVSGLVEAASYQFCAYVSNGVAVAHGGVQSFTTGERGLGERCGANEECFSGLCPADIDDPNLQRCAPVAAPTAAGGAMTFRYVPPTTFSQGSPGIHTEWRSTISRGVFTARTEVTQGQWKLATGGTNPACFQNTTTAACSTANANDEGPVELVDWRTAAAYTNWLSDQEGLERCYRFTPSDWDRTVANWADGDSANGTAATAVGFVGVHCEGYRLLTEAEWELSARGPIARGTMASTFPWGEDASDATVGFYATAASNAGGRTSPVASRFANGFALYDMAGNVQEWVTDQQATYPTVPTTDHVGVSATDTARGNRGGAFSPVAFLRSGNRNFDAPTARWQGMGFRVGRAVPEQPERELGERCVEDADCRSGHCPDDMEDPANRRCVPSLFDDGDGGDLTFRFVPPGSFVQGSPTTEVGRETNETQWTSTITRPYFVSSTEVTQGHWKIPSGRVNPACFQSATGASCSTANTQNNGPIENIDFWAAAAFVNWLSDRAGLVRCYTFSPANWDRNLDNWANGLGSAAATPPTGVTWSGFDCDGYRLLTESEWEWAARAPVGVGTYATQFPWGTSDAIAAASPYAWYRRSGSILRTTDVGIRLPNGLGLYDMGGNVHEWVWDYFGDYPRGSATDYTGVASSTYRTFRGGDWNLTVTQLRPAARWNQMPGSRTIALGIRVARTVPAFTGSGLGKACMSDDNCGAGVCARYAEGTDLHRCAPQALPLASERALEFAPVPGATYTQGSPLTEVGRSLSERQWTATISSDMFVARTPVTQAHWAIATGGALPACFQETSGPNYTCSTSARNPTGPVEQVTWFAAAAYANWLSDRASLPRCYEFTPTDWDRTTSNWADGGARGVEDVTWPNGTDCAGYRLLTESEWEWAARAPVRTGTLSSPYPWGNSGTASTAGVYAWFGANSIGRTRPVAQLLPNGYGLFDMHGLVSEWVWDRFGDYPLVASTDWTGPSTGSARAVRGGDFDDPAAQIRSASRNSWAPTTVNWEIGFRLARSGTK